MCDECTLNIGEDFDVNGARSSKVGLRRGALGAALRKPFATGRGGDEVEPEG